MLEMIFVLIVFPKMRQAKCLKRLRSRSKEKKIVFWDVELMHKKFKICLMSFKETGEVSYTWRFDTVVRRVFSR